MQKFPVMRSFPSLFRILDLNYNIFPFPAMNRILKEIKMMGINNLTLIKLLTLL